jgi:hypothetical protein
MKHRATIVALVCATASLLCNCASAPAPGPYANQTPQQKAENINKNWDAYVLTPAGKDAEAARKKAEKEDTERNSPEGKAREEGGKIARYVYATKCENVFLDMGYDLKCSAVESDKTLMIVGAPVNRVFVHQLLRTLDMKNLKRLGLRTLMFTNGEAFSNYSETYSTGPRAGN